LGYWLKILVVAVGLGLDAMSVCMSVGVKWNTARHRWRLALHMGLFQCLMPLVGWAAGNQLADLLRHVGGYLAAGLVFAVGAKMLYEAIEEKPGSVETHAEEAVEHALHFKRRDPTRGWSLILLSVATSIDALVVGFSLGLRGEHIFGASILIGVVAAAMAAVGVIIGKYLGQAFGKTAEIVGAVVLMGLGASFLWL
jgi:putative Mn2+ efflux pump MntP